MSVSGLVSDIQRYCLHDGPGIRTVVFLKACPLSCSWCANPESQSSQPELMLTSNPCLACELCLKYCAQDAISFSPTDRTSPTPIINWEVCDSCLNCVEVCVTGTLSCIGQTSSVTEIMEIIRLDQPYYDRSGGGVTLSGGEPTAQPDFSQAILQACKSFGIHSAIESSGACEWDSLAMLLPYTDLVFFDLKHIDSALHLKYTGKPNDQILENLARLVKNHANVIVRIPLIPGYNDDDDHMRRLAAYLSSLNQNLELELIPYHRLGVIKYRRLGRKYSFNDASTVEKEVLIEREDFLESLGMRIL